MHLVTAAMVRFRRRLFHCRSGLTEAPEKENPDSDKQEAEEGPDRGEESDDANRHTEGDEGDTDDEIDLSIVGGVTKRFFHPPP